MELLSWIEMWKKQGGSVLFITYTIPHYYGQRLRRLLAGLKKARRLMMNRKVFRKVKERVGLVGSVRALEVTFGFENGWHTHMHELLFVKASLDKEEIAELETKLLVEWQKACVDTGSPEPSGYGLKIGEGEDAASYVAKWGLDCELTKGHMKRGREGRYSPFDLLRAYRRAGPDDKARFASLFLEYAIAFHGQRQLFWWQEKGSRFRELLGVKEEATDEQLASAKDDSEESETVGTLSSQQWDVVVATRVRVEFLQEVERAGWGAGINLIEFQAKRLGVDCQVGVATSEIAENSS